MTRQDWDANALSKMLANPQVRLQNIQILLDHDQKNDFAGINIDYESVPAGSQGDLVSFMQKLYA
jgi:peptidoglycan-N-acetylglucosamine deacetylase